MNLRTLNNQIRRSEAKIAIQLAKNNCHNKTQEINFEWLITWAIKKANKKTPLWCGNVKIMSLYKTDSRQFYITATIHIGSELDTSNQLAEATLHGHMLLNGHKNRLKSYLLTITHNDEEYKLHKPA
ncbi:MAG TPA: hypothetical protein PKE57_11010 [Cellvibrionaceae bacterium]|nr:hypothetical protein [Cellvibrionaceae bacterium]HMW47780.1 hypothetical protein [Cellvibrionaceae bacterium]HMW72164.1 hypothetical protein [Cellvibrionaceae bacterium]HMY40176.1 hypothetical protein [Marinagarivorans sp.]HNG58504.1 hypothetical protein [Cellvibrionaceae bacterium]